MKSNSLLRVVSLLVLLASLVPVTHVGALSPSLAPPEDMFQLPWDQGVAWMAIDGIDNGWKRPTTSSHNYTVGGAIDFAPRATMFTGEDTSNFWVTAAASGVVVGISSCHVRIAHDSGWTTEYQFLGNIQVNLGDAVDRNQRLGIIADGVKYKYCPGYLEPNVPHLHFMLRPSLIGATFAGWQVKYNSLFNSTTFTKDGTTVGLLKPLMNLPSEPPTPTPTPTTTAPPPTATPTTPSGPHVSTGVDPDSINVGETALVTVRLNNVPPEGYTSAEFTCTYDANLVEAGNIVIADLFGADPATAIQGPGGGSLIVAIAGSRGNKATTSGIVFTFSVTGLQAGQLTIECKARVSTGNNALTDLPSSAAVLTVLGLSSTPTPSPTPTVEATLPPITTEPPPACDKAEFIANITIPTGTVVQPGAVFKKTWRVQNVGSCDWTTAYQFVFVSGEQMSAPSTVQFPASVAVGQTVDISLDMTAPSTPGSYQGYWMFRNASGSLFGTGPGANQPLSVDIVVSTSTATPSATPLPPGGDWLTFTNTTYGFEFKYPPQGVIAPDGTDNFTRIDLPFADGTNLRDKYLEVVVVENLDNCRSPLASSSMLETSDIVVINSLSFLKQTGEDGGAGHLYQWVAYSTRRDNVCVSLDFILHSLNPGNFPTPPPVFDFAAESAVFEQIVSTFAWLDSSPTPTPTATVMPSQTPDGSSTPLPSPTSTPISTTGTVTGQVLAGQPVTVSLYADGAPIASVLVNADGTFSLTAPAGLYALDASASGFLGAQGAVTIVGGSTVTLPAISLPAGDIDDNDVIDQFDAMTLGMNYNAAQPSAADLNNDGTINVLDLELLAANYRKMGPVVWE
jgi:hypothetical protein